MKAFVITLNGQYLCPARSSFSGGMSPTWSATIAGARIYGSEAELDKRLLEVSRHCPDDGPWPQVLEVEVSIVRTIEQYGRFERNRAIALKKKQNSIANFERQQQRDAKVEVERLEERLKIARQKAGS